MDPASTLRLARALRPANVMRLAQLREAPILVCGCGRSGTSMLLAMLGAHPKVQAIGEETNVFNQPRRWESTAMNHWNHMRKMADFLLRSPIKSTADRWCEKTPTNVWYIPELLAEFGDKVRIIHIARDGRDVVTSVHPTLKGQYWVRPERWVRDVQLGLAHRDDPRIYTIRYEDIVSDREAALRPLMTFLGLDWHPDMLQHDRKTTVRTINAWEGEVQAVYTSSIAKWKLPEHAAVVDALNRLQKPYGLLEALDYV